MQVNPEHMPPESWTDYRREADNRDEIAILLWRIVAEFIDDTKPLAVPEGTTWWAHAEDYIREHAEEAEQTTILWRDRGAYTPIPGALVPLHQDVITLVLIDLRLDGDYWRIKRSEQHMAFDTIPG